MSLPTDRITRSMARRGSSNPSSTPRRPHRSVKKPNFHLNQSEEDHPPSPGENSLELLEETQNEVASPGPTPHLENNEIPDDENAEGRSGKSNVMDEDAPNFLRIGSEVLLEEMGKLKHKNVCLTEQLMQQTKQTGAAEAQIRLLKEDLCSEMERAAMYEELWLQKMADEDFLKNSFYTKVKINPKKPSPFSSVKEVLYGIELASVVLSEVLHDAVYSRRISNAASHRIPMEICASIYGKSVSFWGISPSNLKRMIAYNTWHISRPDEILRIRAHDEVFDICIGKLRSAHCNCLIDMEFADYGDLFCRATVFGNCEFCWKSGETLDLKFRAISALGSGANYQKKFRFVSRVISASHTQLSLRNPYDAPLPFWIGLGYAPTEVCMEGCISPKSEHSIDHTPLYNEIARVDYADGKYEYLTYSG